MPHSNLYALPIYTSLDHQHHNDPQAYGEKYPLVFPMWPIPFFQFRRKKSTASVSIITLRFLDGVVVSLTSVKNVMQKTTDGDYDYFTYAPQIAPPPVVGMQEGPCYIIIMMSDGVKYYSEVYVATKNIQGYTRLEWSENENIEVGGEKILYEGTGYKNVLYLCSQIGYPDYQYTEEGEERDGHFFALKQISEKVYKITIVAPEYMCDALRLVPLAENVSIIDKDGETYNVEQILVTPHWLEQGNLASVDIEFHTDTICKKIARGYVSR